MLIYEIIEEGIKTKLAAAGLSALALGGISSYNPTKEIKPKSISSEIIKTDDQFKDESNIHNVSLNLNKKTIPTSKPKPPKEIFPNIEALEGSAALLRDEARKNNITGKELALLLAHAAHETGNFKWLEEWSPSKNKIKYFSKKYDKKYQPKKAAILGNDQIGDGYRYRGRGFFQLTGKYNYKQVGDDLNIDLIKNPDLASNPKIAAKIAVWYWKNRVAPKAEDITDLHQTTKPINSALRGLEDRKTYKKHYLSKE